MIQQALVDMIDIPLFIPVTKGGLRRFAMHQFIKIHLRSYIEIGWRVPRAWWS